VSAWINGIKVQALIDTGSTVSMIERQVCCGEINEKGGWVTGVGGIKVEYKMQVSVEVTLGRRRVNSDMLVMNKLVSGVDAIFGMDLIKKLGGIQIDVDGNVSWNSNRQDEKINFHVIDYASRKNMVECTVIDDVDFTARFDGSRWVVRWKWKDIKPILRNTVAQYKVSEEDREEYFKELERWINNGWLVPVERNKNGIIPLMCVKQEAKGKVRPVLDLRGVNKFIHSHTMNTIAVSE